MERKATARQVTMYVLVTVKKESGTNFSALFVPTPNAKAEPCCTHRVAGSEESSTGPPSALPHAAHGTLHTALSALPCAQQHPHTM